MPDKIKSAVLYKKLMSAYGANGTVAPGAFNGDEKSFTEKISKDPKYAEKIYSAMSQAYGDQDFKYSKSDFLAGLGYGQPAAIATPLPEPAQSGPGPKSKPIAPNQSSGPDNPAIQKLLAGAQTLQAPEPSKKGPLSDLETMMATPLAPSEEEKATRRAEDILANPVGAPAPINMQAPTPTQLQKQIKESIQNPNEQYKNDVKYSAEQAQKAEKQYLKTQAEADAYYATPQGKLYYQLVRPVMKTLTETGGNIGAFVARGVGFNKVADNIVDYLSYDNAAKSDRPDAAQFAEPTKVKGNLSIHNVIPKTAEALTGIGTLLAGGEALGGGSLGLIASSYVQTNESYRKAAKDAGLSDGEADAYAATAAGLTSAMMAGSPFKGLLSGKMEQALTKTAPDGVLAAIKNGASVNSAVKEGFKKFAKGLGHAEAFTIGQHMVDASVRYAYDNMVLDKPKFGQESIMPDAHELAQSMAVMAIATGVMMAPGVVRASKPSSLERSAWATAAKDPVAFENSLNKNVESGFMKPEQAAAIKQDVADYSEIFKATKLHGYDDNAASRIALDAFRAKKLDEQNKPISSISVLSPLQEQHAANKATIENDIKDAAIGVPELGVEVSPSELKEKMEATGGAKKTDQLSENNYRVREIDLQNLYKSNKEFKAYIDEEKIKSVEDKEGLRNPPILNADGSIVDGMNRLAQQYIDGNKKTRVYEETKDINVQAPEEISKPRIIEPNLEEKGVTVRRPVEKESIPIDNKTNKENAIQVEEPREVDVRQQAADGERVGRENAIPEVAPRESIKEKAAGKEKEVVPERAIPSPVEEKIKPISDKTIEQKSTRDAALSRLKSAWKDYGKMGIMEDPVRKAKRDKEFYSSLVGYLKEELLYRINTIKDFANRDRSKMRKEILRGMAKEGIPVRDAEVLTRAFNDAHAQVSKIPGTISSETSEVSTKQYYKDKMLARIKGYEKGIKEGEKTGKKTAVDNIKAEVKSARKAIFEILKEAKGGISKVQAKVIFSSLDRVIRSANSRPEVIKRAIDAAAEKAAQIVFEINNKKQIADTRKTLKSIKALKKNKGMVKQDLDWIADSQFPDPARVDDLSTYQAMLNDYNKSRRGEQTDLKYTKEEIGEFIDRQNERIYKEKMDKLEAELQDLKDNGEIPDDVTLDEYKAMLDLNAPPKLKEFKSMKDEVLKNELGNRLKQLKDRLDEFDGHEKEIATELSEVDVSKLNSVDLRILNNILNNIAEYGTFDRAGDIIAADQANKVVAEILSKGYKVRILPSEDIMDKNTLSNTFSSLFHNNSIVADVRSKTLGPVEIAANRHVKTQVSRNAEDITKIFHENNMAGLSNKKIDHFAFLNQWKGMENGIIADELKAGLDKRISDIKYNFDRYKKLGEKEGKSFRDESILNLNALKELELIDGYEIIGKGDEATLKVDIKDGVFDAENPTETLKRAYDKLSDGEKAAYKHATDNFANTKEGVENYAREYKGADFNEWPGGIYFPRTAIRKGEIARGTLKELDLDNGITGNFRSLNKKPGSLLKERAEKFSDDVFYDTDFYTSAIRGYHDALYTAHVMPEVQKLDKIINHPDFKKFLTDVYKDRASDNNKNRTQGEENYTKFKEQLVNALNEEKASPFHPRNGVNWVDEIVSRQVKGVLGNVYQAPRQYIPAVINNMALNNPQAVADAIGGRFKALVDPAYREARNELLSYFTGVQRTIHGNAAYDKAYRKIDESKSWYQYPLDWQAKLQEIASIPLEKSDAAAQHDLYMAGYITSLIKQGKIKNAGEFDIYKESKSPNKEALAYAEQIAAEVNNESAKGYRPNVIKDRRAKAKILWMLQSFNLNAFRFAKQKARIAFGMDPGVTTADRMEAFKHLVGYVGQVGTYNVISKFTKATQLAIGYALINALFGIQKEEENKELAKNEATKEWIKIGAGGVSDLFMGGQNTIVKGILFPVMVNAAYEKWRKKKVASEKQKADEMDEEFSSKGTYLDKSFQPFFIGDNLPGEYAFYNNLYKKALGTFDPPVTEKDAEGMLPEDKRLSELSKYIAPVTQTLGLSDFIIFERSMENALRKNKKNKEANAKEKE